LGLVGGGRGMLDSVDGVGARARPGDSHADSLGWRSFGRPDAAWTFSPP